MAKKKGIDQLDLFVSDFTTWGPKSDKASLEHPFFTLSRRKDLTIKKYRSPDGRVSLEVTPSVKGAATIYDKDIIIYAITILRDSINKQNLLECAAKPGAAPDDGQREVEVEIEETAVMLPKEGVADQPVKTESRPINIIAYNLLNAIERGTSGRAYKDLEEALDRLEGTSIKTNIPVGKGFICTESFHIIEKVKIIREEVSNKMLSIQIILSDWLWTAAVEGNKDLLSIEREYFSLTGLERRIYELCRKHCGYQSMWCIGIDKLYIKSGSNATLREFRRMVRDITEKGDKLPRYRISYDAEKDQLVAQSKVALDLKEKR